MNLDQARGMLVGLAVGDALGAPLEFTGAREPDNYLTEMVGGGAHSTSVGEWTDDTSMALAIAESYQSKSEFQADRIQRSFNAWLHDGAFSWRGKCFDIGHTTRLALGTAKKLLYKNPYAGNMDKYGKGNGALMRMAPVIIANHSNRDRCITEAIQQTLLTHGSNTCVDYSVAFASDLFACGESNKYQSLQLPKDIERRDVMSGGYVKETYECAWWAVDHSTNFEDAIVLAVNRGHDADTVGAVTGQLAGVKYGYNSIPKRWLDVLKMHDNILETADNLHQLGCKNQSKLL
jgi:ADP-ribosyl-[dinitrogen reductase] hydrolase